MNRLPYLIIIALCAIILFRPSKVESIPGEIVRDSISRIDTIRDTVPVPYHVRIVDSIPFPVIIPLPGDTVHDTVYIPISQKVYRDSLYTAYVSGYCAKLDSIEVYSRTNTITIQERARRKRWGLGLQAGYGLIRGKPGCYVGLGVSYNLFEW